jgi:hypothetical protein
MPTKLGIINSALLKLGADRLTSLSENRKSAILMNEQWDEIRQKVLREGQFNFSIKRVELAQNSTAPTFGWTFAYNLPADCLRVLKFARKKDDDFFDYQIEGRTLVTDENSAKIRYIFDATDASQFDVGFAEALSWCLAADLGYAITQNAQMVSAAVAQYEKAIKAARSMDAQEGTPDEIEDDEWIISRF